MKFWALGKETPKQEVSNLQRILQKITKKGTTPAIEYYKRIVVAIRLKTDDKIMLKSFKEIPCKALEQLLPDGRVMMSKFDSTVMYTMLACSGLGLFAKIVTWLAHYQVNKCCKSQRHHVAPQEIPIIHCCCDINRLVPS